MLLCRGNKRVFSTNMTKYLPEICKVFSGICLLLSIGCGPPERYQLKLVTAQVSLEEYERGTANADAQMLYEQGGLYLQKGRTRAAKEVFTRLVEKVPDEADAHFYLGVALAKEHLKTEAVASFRRALDIEPGLAESHWALALLYNERGDGYQDALKAAQEGLKLDPHSAYGHFVLGFVLCSRGDNESAESMLIKAVELDPEQAHAHYYLALIYLRLQDDVKAIASMENTVEADPSYTEAYYSLGTLYARTGRVDDGQRMIELFQELSSADMEEDHYRRLLYRKSEPLPPKQRAASHFNLGLVYLKRGDLDKAENQFTAAIAADSSYAEALHNMGVVLSLRDKHAEALAYFRAAVRQNPRYALAYKNMGNSYLVQGQYSQAEESFRQALTLDGQMVEAMNGLGTALIQQGKIEDGRQAREQAVRLAAKRTGIQ